MQKDPILRQRLEAAAHRRDSYLESEVRAGDRRPEETPQPQAAEDRQLPSDDRQAGQEEDGIPEVGDDDGEEIPF